MLCPNCDEDLEEIDRTLVVCRHCDKDFEVTLKEVK